MMYTGAMEKGQMHGKGTLVYPNSERYEGDFRHGKRHGYGVDSYQDGGRFEGEQRSKAGGWMIAGQKKVTKTKLATPGVGGEWGEEEAGAVRCV